MALVNFGIFFATSLLLLAVFLVLYWKSTPYDDFGLIAEGNVAVAIGFGGAAIGFTIPLGMSLAQSDSIQDLLVWGGTSMAVQLAVYWAAYWVFARGKIEQGNTAAGTLLAGLSIAVGILNAASQTY